MRMRDIMKYYKPLPLVVFSFFISVIDSLLFPIFGLLFTKVLFSLYKYQLDTFYEEARFWCLMFLALAISHGIAGGL